MVRTFTHHDEGDMDLYSGFNKAFGAGVDFVTIVLVDGEVDLYAVDHPYRTEDLARFLREQVAGKVQILGTYKRIRINLEGIDDDTR